ncbi:MAG: histidinol-phosphate aminotransferase family protein [Opitutaceae bacterium]|jgi:histidinol-phosphate aminotransferase|nr:histidinol-phosphate aminotransferase family protein [Opitutaceae bacterium]MBP9911947.1 histidinol-phosphate aminotransferase family protein [Opitutaceae bacterium]
MKSTLNLNRRQWLKTSGAALAGLTLAGRLTAQTQPVVVADASATGPVQLSLNENPFGPSARAVMAMREQVERVCRYPFNRTPELIQALAAKEGVPDDHIVLGVGSGEILETYGVYLARDRGEVISARPGYFQLVGAMERMGATAVAVPLNERLEHDLEAMAAKIGPDTKCIYLCNPNNPTGTVVPPDKLRAFAIEVSKRVPVFIDEAYLECADDFAANTMVGLVRDGHNVTVARTFSKIYGLAGQRIGYGVMRPEMAKSVRTFMTGSVNLLGVVAAQASLADAGYVEATRRKIKAGRDAFIAELKQLGRRYAEPQGNFVFFHTGRSIVEFQSAIRAEGVLVARPFPPLLDWCRISIGTPEEMAAAHAALRKVLG